MAELYPPGIQRIFYRASKDGDLVVTAKLLDPNLISEDHDSFLKAPGSNKVYYVDVNFYMEGIWLAVFYENGIEKAFQAYNTKKIPSISSAINIKGNILNK